MEVSFFGGGNRRKPPTCSKAKANLMLLHTACTSHERDSNSQLPYDHDHDGPDTVWHFSFSKEN